MGSIEEIIGAIRTLSEGERVYEGIHLSVEEQTHGRAKPKRYLELTCQLFEAIGGRTIVEIGCMRSPLEHPIAEMHPRCCNDGHSTYHWARSGAAVHSVDIDRKAVAAARRSCKGFSNCRVLRRDGIAFLEKFSGTIDLLFLDAWDVEPGSDYAENHLLAYLKAKPKLASRHIISIDDTDVGDGGKGRLLLPVLEVEGYDILVRGRQTIALKR